MKKELAIRDIEEYSLSLRMLENIVNLIFFLIVDMDSSFMFHIKNTMYESSS